MTTAFGNGYALGTVVVLQPYGRIREAGTAFNVIDRDIALARYQVGAATQEITPVYST